MYYREVQEMYNLSDDYMARPIHDSENHLRQTVAALGWKLNNSKVMKYLSRDLKSERKTTKKDKYKNRQRLTEITDLNLQEKNKPKSVHFYVFVIFVRQQFHLK